MAKENIGGFELFDRLQKLSERASTSKKRPVIQNDNIDFRKQDLLKNSPQKLNNKFKGIGGDRLIEPVPKPFYYPGDSYLEGENNAGIIASRDEIYRQRGHTKSGALYAYAGRSPNDIVTEGTDENGAIKVVYKPNDLIADASYLYLSQKADVDSLYRGQIAGGTYSKAVRRVIGENSNETRQGLSLAALKADDVLIMSKTSGIRLVAATDKYNSLGGENLAKYGIDLIAGNDDSDLQPLVKGDNLVLYLSKLSGVVDDLRKIVIQHITNQMKFNTKVMNHKHPDPFMILLNTTSGQPVAVLENQNFPSPNLQAAGGMALLSTLKETNNTVSQILNRLGNDQNALTKLGSYNILSEGNRTN